MRYGLALFAVFLLVCNTSAADALAPQITLAVIGSCVEEDGLREALLVEWGQKKGRAPSVLITCKGETIAVELYGHGRQSELEYPSVALPAEARERSLALLIAESEASLEQPVTNRPLSLVRQAASVGPDRRAVSDSAPASTPSSDALGSTDEGLADTNSAELPSGDFAKSTKRRTQNFSDASPYVETVETVEDVSAEESWRPKAVLFAGPLVRAFLTGGWLAGGNLTLGYSHAQLGVDITASDANDVPSSDTSAFFGYAFLQEKQRTFRPNLGLRARGGITSARSRSAGYVGASLFGYFDAVFSSIMRLRLTGEIGHAGFSPDEDIKRIQGFFVATGLSLGATGGGNGL